MAEDNPSELGSAKKKRLGYGPVRAPINRVQISSPSISGKIFVKKVKPPGVCIREIGGDGTRGQQGLPW
jgi:hypothetical protein